VSYEADISDRLAELHLTAIGPHAASNAERWIEQQKSDTDLGIGE
jgi:hypothetical protein